MPRSPLALETNGLATGGIPLLFGSCPLLQMGKKEIHTGGTNDPTIRVKSLRRIESIVRHGYSYEAKQMPQLDHEESDTEGPSQYPIDDGVKRPVRKRKHGAQRTWLVNGADQRKESGTTRHPAGNDLRKMLPTVEVMNQSSYTIRGHHTHITRGLPISEQHGQHEL